MRRGAATAALAAGGAVAAAAGALAWSVLSPESQLLGPVLVAPRRPREIALTFDDGPNRTATPYLLDLLALHGVRATFFLIGRYAESEPGLVQQMVEAGHTVGNHTMTHPRLPLCSPAQVLEEMRGAKQVLEDVAGVPVSLFRPPHGYRTPEVLRVARELGMVTVNWNVIANDWTLPTAALISGRVARGIERNRARGWATNAVLHDGSQQTPTADRLKTVSATAFLLERFAAEGAEFVTLDGWAAAFRAAQP